MDVSICSRDDLERLLQAGLPQNTAVISFYDPPGRGARPPVELSGQASRVFQVAVNDVDLSVLPELGLSYDTYFTEAEELAEFIYAARDDGCDILCQCVYGESRSAACAAAILEHFFKNGISIFADYRYYPNQVVYHKVLDALEAYQKRAAQDC